MANILLEFEQLNILVKKKIWKLYFIVVAEHPTDPDKMVISTIPAAGQDYFRLKKMKDRDFGYLVMDEEFGSEFDGKKELDRTNFFTTHQARLRWSWRIKK